MIKTTNDLDFEQNVIRNTKDVLVKFGSPSCAPCRAMEPILDQVSEEKAATLDVFDVNVDEFNAWAKALQIRSIPALFIFRGGRILKKATGAMPLASMRIFCNV